MISNLEIAIRLFLSLILGGLIGLERETRGRPAGFRTHILVSVGSTLVMLVSAYAFYDFELVLARGYDPGRIAAQVISGIGFLGAGTILREGANIRGLTTAASLWSVAGIGLAVGAGFYFPAIMASLIVVGALILLNRLEWKYFSYRNEILEIRIEKDNCRLSQALEVLEKLNVNVFNIQLDSSKNGETTIMLEVVLPSKECQEMLLEELFVIEGVTHVGYK